MTGFAYFNGEDWIEISLGEFGLPANSIQALATCGSNDIWIGTGQGICYYNGSEWITYDSQNSNLIGDVIMDISIDSSGNVWAVTRINNGGVVISYGFAYFNGEEWLQYTSQNSLLPHNGTDNIIIDNDDNVWITCGTYLIKIVNEIWTIYNFQDYGFSESIQPTALSFDQYNNIWIGLFEIEPSFNNYLVRFDGECFEIIYNNDLHLIGDIVVDQSNVIWFSSGNGLTKIEGTDITIYNQNNSPLPSNGVGDLEIEEYVLWISCDGLVKKDGDEWTLFNTSNSALPVNTVICIAIDDDGTKWIGTQAGLVEYNENFVAVQDEFQVEENAPKLIYNYPNPFNPETTIYFTVENTGDAKIEIYNLKGQKIKTLYPSPSRGLETRSVIWDGTDENNQPVCSGVYFYQLLIDGKPEASKKMMLLK